MPNLYRVEKNNFPEEKIQENNDIDVEENAKDEQEDKTDEE